MSHTQCITHTHICIHVYILEVLYEEMKFSSANPGVYYVYF